jgi:hypothetical protein
MGMRTIVRFGSLTGCLLAVSTAWAAPTDFSAGSWIIPMDACLQPTKSFNGSSFASSAQPSTIYSSCPDTSGTAYDGVLKAYGLVYRLLQNGIPVYYILNTNKSTVDDIDLTITASSANPVQLLNHDATSSGFGTSSNFMSAGHTSISYRGAPFIISASDVPAAQSLIKTNSNLTDNDARTGRAWFKDVYIHVAKTNILQAPVRAILLQTPPKIALMDINGASIDVLNGYLQDSGLYNATAVAAYPTIGDVFTQFRQVSDFTTSNGLTAGGFAILWAPHWNANLSITQSQRDAITAQIASFVDAGHPFLGQCAAVAAFEGSADQSNKGYNIGGDPNGFFITTGSGSDSALETNLLPQPDFPSGSGQSIVVNPDTTVKAWLDPLTQTGDFPLAIVGVSSYIEDFQANSGFSFKPFVKTYVQSSTSSSSTNKLPIETVAYKDGDSRKGLIIYLGGHAYGSDTSSGCSSGNCVSGTQFNMVGLERLVLNSLIFLGQTPSSSEQTRSAPIVYQGDPQKLDGRTYLGSYVQQTQASAAFPPWTGHFREYLAGALSGSNVTSFGAINANWDSYNNIKSQAASDSRNIYTAVNISGKMTQIAFTTTNLSSIQSNGGCTANNVTAANLTSIRTGLLGGVDHSIPAIIPSSSIAGASSRPTVAYFGALDGMVHAILVDGTVSGKNPGDELWAFIPPSQLCKVFAQSAGVDGSPNVGDAFIDIGSGIKSWRTLLAIPDGNYAGGTLDVIDVTDPTTGQPKFLWEASDSFTANSKTYVLGRAQGAAISPILTHSGVQYAYFVATDNTNGNAGNGFNVYALDAGTGTVIWRYNRTYPNDTTHNDVPGTAAVIDSAGDGGPVNHVWFGDVEGKVWDVNAITGTATMAYDAAQANGQTNSINYPIESAVVLYRDPGSQDLDVLGVTGGADWVPSTTLSQVFRYDTKTAKATNVATLAPGERVYAVPTIAGNQAYIITSLGQLQSAIGNAFTSTGNIIRINLGSTGGTTTLATVKQGAGEVAVDSNGNVIAASATGITQNGNAGRDQSQAVTSLQYLQSKLLKVRAWLDLH